MSNLNQEELHRFSRQILIPEFGELGQQKLKKSSVLVVGAGGLGSPVLLYLAAAGIGKIGIVEYDKIDSSNLQRQILYSEDQINKSKIDEAEKRILQANKSLNVEKHAVKIDSNSALEIIEKYDIVVDCSDNFSTRYLISDSCILREKTLVYGAIYRFEGQVSVFNFQGGPTYRDLFPKPPPEELSPNCATAGVLGMMAGVIGSLQAIEVIKVLTGIGKVLSGELLMVEALSMNFRKVKILVDSQRPKIEKLIDYDSFCATSNKQIESISYSSFLKLKDYQLIDVRERSEFEVQNLGGELMPLSEIEMYLSQIKKDKTVVVHCQSGQRSKRAIQILKEKHGFNNLINLEGGINASGS